jgi:hypothetical protein
MTEQEWKQLTEMRDCIKASGMQSFDPAYMDSYAQLLAKSLEGKGDMVELKTPTNY